MPKNKKNQVVSLTKTKKSQIVDKKSSFVKKVQALVDEYEYTYTLSFKNMTTMAMQGLRYYWKTEDSVFLLGKHTVMQFALGKTEDSSYKPNMYKLAENLRGNCGLFFSNKSPESIVKYFEEYSVPHFPSPGDIATETITLKRGCPVELKKFPSSMEQQFREIGLKFKLDNGKWYLLEDFKVSVVDEKLSPEQCKMLRHLDKRIDEFKIKVTSYNSKTGDYVLVDPKGFCEQKNKNYDLNSELDNDLIIS